ncbi:hypothetical protein UPYG_G00235400 [Umbra pygmaea]|uniref:Liver-expressed antimicrobial peptide 2 n=1 Tax=Umbra pygmaea TaxID=75934 RepID=A0ABD0WE74_UMBPY
MQEHPQHFSCRTAFTWCLVFLVLLQQVSASPSSSVDVQPISIRIRKEGQRILKRIARMTPLWRIMGTKPHGAYCHNNYECSTGICRGGHCVFIQPIKS